MTLNGMCTLLLRENCINLNYGELVHSAFSLPYPLTFSYIHSINSREFDIETPIKDLDLST